MHRKRTMLTALAAAALVLGAAVPAWATPAAGSSPHPGRARTGVPAFELGVVADADPGDPAELKPGR